MNFQAGMWNYDDRPVDKELLLKVSSRVAQYAPGPVGEYWGKCIGFVFRHCCTTRESQLERQPYVSASGKVFIWDGRLDNRDELVRLVGIQGRALTDVELVAEAFDRWGNNCFITLIGDWAVTVWEPALQKLTLARDYMGVRQLFYYPKPTSLVWASHLEPLATCGDVFTLCEAYLGGYLISYPDAHLTPYAELRSVPPGHFVEVSDKQLHTYAYWKFNPRLSIRYRTDHEYEDHFRHLLRQSIRDRLRSDSRILADLSGGLDSSAIVCLADDVLSKDEDGLGQVDTFSFLVFDEPGEEDSRYLNRVEERRGRIGRHIVLSDANSDTSILQTRHFSATPGFKGRPDMDAMKAAVIHEGRYKVLLSGTGGDEVLGQALDPRIQLADLLRYFQIRDFLTKTIEWSLLLKRPAVHLIAESCLLQLPGFLRAPFLEAGRIEAWLNRSFALRQKLSRRQLTAAEGRWSWSPSTRDWFQTLQALSRRMSIRPPSLEETRYPFLDRRLIEFLIAIPTEQLLRPGHRRSLMRRALSDLLPQEIVQRKTKSSGGRYFSVAFQKHWETIEAALESSWVERLGFVNGIALRRTLGEITNGILPAYFLRVVRALALELWLKDTIERGILKCPSEKQGLIDHYFLKSSA
ncbi:MAG TPA: asparagine synthase-related protein [Candidatus Angelobacter sp.]|nr:asparagine synthase-related protein [Candidatus Angelobacter sp.]